MILNDLPDGFVGAVRYFIAFFYHGGIRHAGSVFLSETCIAIRRKSVIQ
jgi:hypothetical protein